MNETVHGVPTELIDAQLERIHLALGGKPDDEWELVRERDAVALLDQLSSSNRKALLHVAAVERDSDRYADIDFICAVARYHYAQPEVVAAGLGWTPAPGRRIMPQETVSLRLSQYVLGSVQFEVEV